MQEKQITRNFIVSVALLGLLSFAIVISRCAGSVGSSKSDKREKEVECSLGENVVVEFNDKNELIAIKIKVNDDTTEAVYIHEGRIATVGVFVSDSTLPNGYVASKLNQVYFENGKFKNIYIFPYFDRYFMIEVTKDSLVIERNFKGRITKQVVP